MRRTLSLVAGAGVLVAGLGLGLAAEQKPATSPAQKPAAGAAQPSVTVYKSPT